MGHLADVISSKKISFESDVYFKRILLIDDDMGFQRYFCRIFDQYEVKVCSNSALCISMAEQFRPDIIIIDVNIESGLGFKICRQIRLLDGFKTIPIIILSARKNSKDKIMGLDSGADDYVEKPFSYPELAARMRAIVRSYK